MKNEKQKKQYLGIIFLPMGASYFTGDNIGKVATDCAKTFKQDWSHLFKIKKSHVHPVNIYDATETSGKWHCDMRGIVTDPDTDKEIPFLKTVYAVS